MIGNAPLSPITGVPGWESPAEQDLLLQLAQAVPYGGVIIEIGSEFGMSASIFLKATENTAVQVGCVDLFPDNLQAIHQQNLQEAGLQIGRIQYSQQDSKKGFVPNPIRCDRSGHSIDLLFIDGDHTYAGCKADIDAWTPHVKVGGRVAFHDTACATNLRPHRLHEEVTQAITEWQTGEAGADWALRETVDSIMVFERTESLG